MDIWEAADAAVRSRSLRRVPGADRAFVRSAMDASYAAEHPSAAVDWACRLLREAEEGYNAGCATTAHLRAARRFARRLTSRSR